MISDLFGRGIEALKNEQTLRSHHKIIKILVVGLELVTLSVYELAYCDFFFAFAFFIPAT